VSKRKESSLYLLSEYIPGLVFVVTFMKFVFVTVLLSTTLLPVNVIL